MSANEREQRGGNNKKRWRVVLCDSLQIPRGDSQHQRSEAWPNFRVSVEAFSASRPQRLCNNIFCSLDTLLHRVCRNNTGVSPVGIASVWSKCVKRVGLYLIRDCNPNKVLISRHHTAVSNRSPVEQSCACHNLAACGRVCTKWGAPSEKHLIIALTDKRGLLCCGLTDQVYDYLISVGQRLNAFVESVLWSIKVMCYTIMIVRLTNVKHTRWYFVTEV